jgi:flagellar basal-body rod protein FlgB
MLSGIDLFRVTGDAMRYLTERQTVIARNIANVDTPDYKAQDLAPFSPAGAASGVASSSGDSPLTLVQTNPGHLPLAADSATTSQPVVVTDPAYGAKPNGNTVSVEEQMVKSADVSNAFALANAAYAKSVSIMKLAITG